jgi:hypothetical protein
MSGDASAYDSLGLDPGADAGAVERAYKRLIKEHHPDRDGGDSARAAEINRAYRELRKPRSEALAKDALELHDHPVDDRRRRIGWVIPAVCAIGGVAALVLATGPMWSSLRDWSPASAQTLPLTSAAAAAVTLDGMDKPLSAAAIDGAVSDARHIAATGDEMGLAAASTLCHRKLRGNPDVAQLDRCAAFDDAVVQLQDRDPLRDRGPFSELAVTGRQWSAASELSNDYLAIDGRLDRIRLRVELALAQQGIPAEAD